MSKVLKVLTIFFFFVSLLYLSKNFFLHFYPDFTNYYYGPKLAFENINPYLGNRNLYTPFVYPPFVLVFFYPFAIFPFHIAEILWVCISIILLLISLFFLFKINNASLSTPLGYTITAIVLLFYFPIKFTLGMGQINNLILFFVVLSIFFLNKNKYVLSGFLISLSILIKLFPGLLLIYFLLEKKWKLLVSFTLTIAIFSGLTFLINPQLNIYFYTHVLSGLLGSTKGDYYNQALSGFLIRTVSQIHLRYFLQIFLSITLTFISFFVILKTRNNHKDLLSIGLLIALNVLINNFSWQHHFVWMLVPFFNTFFYIKQHKLSRKYYFVLLISFLLVGMNLAHPDQVPMLFRSHVFIGGFLLWFLIMHILYKSVRSRNLV